MGDQEKSNETTTRGNEKGPSGSVALYKSMLTEPQQLCRQRGQKIQEHLETVLQSEDALRACMGAVLCDILEMSQVLKIALGEKIGQAPSAAAGVSGAMPLVQVYLQTIRQAERLANLDCRIRESRSSLPEVPASD